MVARLTTAQKMNWILQGVIKNAMVIHTCARGTENRGGGEDGGDKLKGAGKSERRVAGEGAGGTGEG